MDGGRTRVSCSALLVHQVNAHPFLSLPLSLPPSLPPPLPSFFSLVLFLSLSFFPQNPSAYGATCAFATLLFLLQVPYGTFPPSLPSSLPPSLQCQLGLYRTHTLLPFLPPSLPPSYSSPRPWCCGGTSSFRMPVPTTTSTVRPLPPSLPPSLPPPFLSIYPLSASPSLHHLLLTLSSLRPSLPPPLLPS